MLVSLQGFIINSVALVLSIFALYHLLHPNRFFRFGASCFLLFTLLFIAARYFVFDGSLIFLNTFILIPQLLFILCCFDDPTRDAFAALVSYTFPVSGVFAFSVWSLQLSGITSNPLEVPSWDRFWIFLICCGFLMLGSLLTIFLLKRISVWRKLPSWAVFTLTSVYVGTTIFWEISNAFIGDFGHMTVFACMVLCVLLFFTLLIFVNERAANNRRVLYLECQHQNVIRYYEKLAQENAMISQLRDELAAELCSVQDACREPQKAQQLLSKLGETLQKTKSTVSTGNSAVDALLHSKQNLAQEKNCRIDAALSLKENCGIADIDLVCILANLLDNALSAAHEGDIVKAEGTLRAGLLALEVRNPAHGTEQIPERIVFPKVWNREHGIGLASVKHTVQQYNGSFSLAKKEESVIACVVLECQK